MSIEQRIQGRKDFESVLNLLIFDKADDKDYQLGIANGCQAFVDSHLKTKTLLTMNEEEAKRFERERIAFGKYQGTAYKEVPNDYLEWLADQAIRLQSYLRWRAMQSLTEQLAGCTANNLHDNTHS